MIDFTGVTAIMIPEGSVRKIMRGTEVLWERVEPEVPKDEIVMGNPVSNLTLGASYSSLKIT